MAIAGYIHTQGPTTLLSATGKTSTYSPSGSTSLEGDWFRIHPQMGRFYFTCKLTGTSVGSTATATVQIEGSNDGVTAASTALLTWSGITLTTDTVVLGSPVPSSLQAQWGYVRANMTSLTTSTAGSTASAAANVTVITNGGYVGIM
jgi:hypothetical protein